jgi:hypothetical protein
VEARHEDLPWAVADHDVDDRAAPYARFFFERLELFARATFFGRSLMTRLTLVLFLADLLILAGLFRFPVFLDLARFCEVGISASSAIT